MNGLELNKKLVALKNRARNLCIHIPEQDTHLKSNLRAGRYVAGCLRKQPDGFWFSIPQVAGKPLPAYIRRIDMAVFELYVCYDDHFEVKRKARRFGKGGISYPSPATVTQALDDCFREAFAIQRTRPDLYDMQDGDKLPELPLFADQLVGVAS